MPALQLKKYVRFMDLDRKSHTLHQACIFNTLAKEDLHPSQLPILWAISQTSRITQGEIASILGVSRSAVALSAKRMERAGLVRRMKDAADQRLMLVSITPKGLAAAHRARALQEELLSRRLRGFSPEEVSVLIGFYERMNHNLEEYRQELELQAAPKKEAVC